VWLLGQKRFIGAYCGALNEYYDSLHNEAESETERAAVQILHERMNSIRIAFGIVKSFTRERGDEAHNNTNTRALERESKNYEGKERLNDKQRHDANTSDRKRMTNTGYSTQSFFLRGPAFREFTRNIWLLTLKSSLWEVIDNAPSSQIYISSEDKSTLSNRLKLSAEKYTDKQWEWWPLAAPVPRAPSGMKRLEWKVRNHIAC
jgi:hypothetical protein